MDEKYKRYWFNEDDSFWMRHLKKIAYKISFPLLQMTEDIQGDLNKNISELHDFQKKIQELKEELENVFVENQQNKRQIQILRQSVEAHNKCSTDTIEHIANIWQEKIEKTQERADKYEQDQADKLGALARELTRTRWQLVDFFEAKETDDNTTADCPICNSNLKIKDLKILETTCIFGGGKLVRYVCPVCGGIFGPLKFSRQTKEEKDDDYVINYLGYKEANSTDGEIKTFEMLSPAKDGVYLNYGCGVWSQTIELLNQAGYHVFGYEPYASDIDNPYIINDIEVLKKMRFDGIFSHDLLEHLNDPAEELLFMKSLLKDTNSKMAHSTACYEYKYEFTRFHTCFYTGNAVQYLCKRAGLKVLEYKDDENKKDFICYVYGVQDDVIDISKFMYPQNAKKIRISGEEGVIWGPYINLNKGLYKLYLNLDYGKKMKSSEMLITAEKGKKVLFSLMVSEGESVQKFELLEDEQDVEFVFRTVKDQEITLNKIGFI